MLPLNDLTETLQFNDQQSNTDLNLDAAAFFAGISIQSMNGNTYQDITGSHSLMLGAGGIAISGVGGTYVSISFDVPIVLAAPQTWDASSAVYASITANNAISGGYGLTLSCGSNTETFAFNSGASTFSGGVTVPGGNSTVVVGASSSGPAGAPTSGPFGTGAVIMGDGTTLTTSSSSPITIANPLTIGDATSGSMVTLGGSSQGNYGPLTNLTFTGPVTLTGYVDPNAGIIIGPNSIITFSGALSGSEPDVWFTIQGSKAGTSRVIIQGAMSNFSGLNLSKGVTLILDGAGPSQVPSMSEGIETSSHSYLGLGAGYSAAGNVSSFIGILSDTDSEYSFRGTLGFDTTSGPAATFSDPIDLTNFTDSRFVGLGSATSAILGAAAIITPPSDSNTYYFGGGGGMLTVESPLADLSEGSYTNLYLTHGNSALTLVLSGALSYTGATSITRAALIFDTPPPSGSIILNNGYAGSTPNSGYTDAAENIQGFISLFNDSEQSGVIGFDSFSGPRTVTSAIDMSVTGSGYFLGTATSVIYSGLIIPYYNQYQFAGVKGGQVTVSSPLTDGEEEPNSVVVGLQHPLESQNVTTGQVSLSSVTLSGENTYSGGTTLNSGYLYVTNPNSLGSGPLYVPGNGGTTMASATMASATLAPSGGPVTLYNAIYIAGNGLALLDNGISNQLTLNGSISDYDETPGTLRIFGPVDLEGNNSYSGGTIVGTNGATLTVGQDTGLGSGSVTAYNSTLHFLSASPVINQLSISNSVATFDGSPVINGLEAAETSFNFNGASATINSLESDQAGSGNYISLGSGTVLTMSTNNEENSSPSYHGIIAGATGSLVVTGGGMLTLTGNNSYGGGTTLSDETLLVASNNHALGTGGVTIGEGSGLFTNTGVVLTNPITLNDGGGLGGFGTFSPGGNITFSNGSMLDPGSPGLNNTAMVPPTVGKLSFGGGTSLTFDSGGFYWFSISSANGSPGAGYSTVDLASGGGTLTFASTALSPFTIDLQTIDPMTNQPGSLQDFNSAQAYSWTLVSASSLAGPFDPSYFYIDATGFANSLGAGHFYVSESGNSLMLDFTPVPEPATWALMVAGIGALCAAIRRRRR
jgi:autotransporter-associated beta strand protein